MSGSGGPGAEEQDILDRMVERIVAILGAVAASAVRVDVDPFDGTEALVEGWNLDSLHLLEIAVALEDMFDMSLTDDPDLPSPLTLQALAGYVAAARSSA